MRATAHHLSPASVFLITSLREQTGVQDGLCRCVCTAAPPVIVIAAPPVVVVDITSDTEEDENMADVSSEEEVVAVPGPATPTPATYVHTGSIRAYLDWVFDEQAEQEAAAAAAPPATAPHVTSPFMQALYDDVFRTD